MAKNRRIGIVKMVLNNDEEKYFCPVILGGGASGVKAMSDTRKVIVAEYVYDRLVSLSEKGEDRNDYYSLLRSLYFRDSR